MTPKYYLGVMKNTKNKGVHGQGPETSNGHPKLTLTPDEFRKALEKDFSTLSALIAFIRSTPSILDEMARIAYEIQLNKIQDKEAENAIR